MRTVRAPVAGAMLVLVLATTAVAGDGVIEINQARALAGGVTGSDTAGFPVTLDVPGSYALSGNLTPPADTMAVAITASDVTLDLRGFGITGSGTPGLAYRGVDISAGSNAVEVRNGTIRNFPRDGIYAASCTGCRVVDMRLYNNGWTGALLVGSSSFYRNCTAYQNANAGLYAQGGSSFIGNVVYNNGVAGIYLSGSGGVVESNTAYLNTGNGISVGSGVTVRGNAAYQNGAAGISISQGVALENTSVGNSGFQLSMGTASGYADNVLSTTGSGAVSSGVNMGGNVCGAALCP